MAALRWLVVEMLEQQHAVEVVELVLEQPGEQLVGLERHLVAVEVDAHEMDLLRAHDLEREARAPRGSPPRRPTRRATRRSRG